MNILIVEDDKGILDFLKTSLKMEGFVIDTSEEGHAGLRKAINNDYDLIMLDIGLPGKDGRQICSELRSVGRATPVIMLSVKGEIDTKIELLNIGADDYIVK